MKMANLVSNSNSPMLKVEIMNKLVINEIPDDISDEEKTSCIIAKDLQIPMLSNPEFRVKTKMKMEIKEEINLQIKNEILDEFSAEEQTTFAISMDLPIPKMADPTVEIKTDII